MVTLPSWVASTDFGTWYYRFSFCNFTPISLRMLKCSWAQTPSCLLMHSSFANICHANRMYSTVSSNRFQSLHLLSVSHCNICVAWHLVCNAWFCAAIISLAASPFRSPFDSHINMSSPPISCLSILLTRILPMLSHFVCNDSPNLAIMC